MSNWPGKYVIGLTGNIATGKSVVRRMLEHLGAYTIDADALSHRVISKGAPGYQPVLDTFGKWLLGPDGQINRTKLGNLVFADKDALKQLEDIIHPYVRQAIDILVKRASQKVIVIEAIKLLELELRSQCDTVWVTDAPQQVQVERLMRKRGMSQEDALQRVQVQSAQKEKLAAANLVITNNGSYDDLWKQVSEAWKQISPAQEAGPTTQVMTKPAAGITLSAARETTRRPEDRRLDHPPEQRQTDHDKRPGHGSLRRESLPPAPDGSTTCRHCGLAGGKSRSTHHRSIPRSWNCSGSGAAFDAP